MKIKLVGGPNPGMITDVIEPGDKVYVEFEYKPEKFKKPPLPEHVIVKAEYHRAGTTPLSRLPRYICDKVRTLPPDHEDVIPF